ncbi:MAG: hypothetical protein V4754_03565 [Pseudomonadota bacterium]
MSGPRIAAKCVALTCGAALLGAICHYPFGNTWLGPILLAYAALLCWRPHCWLFALPAWLPVLDLAPWTGWFMLEEIDLLLLLTCVVLYWQAPRGPRWATLPAAATAGIAGLSLAYTIALLRGMVPLSPPDANALAHYHSSYNALRLGKAWFWALLLLPALLRDAGPQLCGLRRYALPGMLTGLTLVTLADLRERWLFPGLSNFSTDYRTSAPFSGMHTGGAALDGYLALTAPLLVLWLLDPPRHRHGVAALAILALAAYAGLTTFSRGLFAAYACSAALIGAALLLAAWRRGALRWRGLAGGGLVLTLLAFSLEQSFASAGYRGFAASLAVLGAAFLLASLPVPARLLPATCLCGAALACALAAAPAWPGPDGLALLKPPYLLLILSCAGFACAMPALLRRATAARDSGPTPPTVLAAALVAFACMLCAAVWIAWHRAGQAALAPAILPAALALLLLAVRGRNDGRAPRWQIGRASLTTAAAIAIAMLAAIPISASYYAGERFASSAHDLQTRLEHWRAVLAMLDQDPMTAAFGMGLGSFPRTYFWRNRDGEMPADFRYLDQGGNRFLRLSAPQYRLGYGEVLRLLQHVEVQPHTRYRLTLDMRGEPARPALTIRLCERLLLYPQGCVSAPLRPAASDGRWRRHHVTVDSGALGDAPWPRRAPVQLELAVDGAPGTVDIDNLSLRSEAGGPELLRNGTFMAGHDYWFFSSDRHHLPWHIKNLPLHLYAETGWFGLLSWSLLVACALATLARQVWRGQAGAAPCLAALTGFLVVGVFDSLLDVPRLALLFYLLLLCALLRPLPSPLSVRRPRRSLRASAPPAAASLESLP